MGFEEIFVDYVAAEQERKDIEELIKILAEDYESGSGAMQELKEFVEGTLVDTLQEAVEILGKWITGLIDVFGKFMVSIATHLQNTENADKEGADKLKEALNT